MSDDTTPLPGDSGAPLDLEPIRLRLSEVRGARAGRWDFHRAVGATVTFNAHAARDVEVLLAEVDRLTAALTACEDRCNALANRCQVAEWRLELAAMGREGVPRG